MHKIILSLAASTFLIKFWICIRIWCVHWFEFNKEILTTLSVAKLICLFNGHVVVPFSSSFALNLKIGMYVARLLFRMRWQYSNFRVLFLLQIIIRNWFFNQNEFNNVQCNAATFRTFPKNHQTLIVNRIERNRSSNSRNTDICVRQAGQCLKMP